MNILPPRWKHLWLLLLYPLMGVGFSAVEYLVPEVVNVMEWQPVDGWIPFVPVMVLPYVFWYATIIFTLGWTAWHDAMEFRRFVAFLYLGMASAYVVYLVWPNGQNLRPPLDSLGGGWINDMVRWIYTHDTPTNCNPSIHVLDAVGVWIALGRDRILGKKPWFQIPLALVSLAIIASTVLLKQHSVVDIFGGLAWAGLWWFVAYSRWSPLFRPAPGVKPGA